MSPVPRISICLFVFICLSVKLQAENLTAYRVGDRANADIATPVSLDLIDSTATAALRSARALEVPVVFRSFPEATNLTVREFQAVFTQTRTHFLAEMAATAPSPADTNTANGPANLDRLITAFNSKNQGLPVTGELAAEWARGGDGAMIREKLLGSLSRAAGRLVRPDDLPEGFVPGETIRLVPVADLDQKLTFDEVQHGQVVPTASLVTVSAARKLLRDAFPATEQPLARALAAFLEPNCFPDAPFTQLVRGTAVYQLVVSEHFDAGEVIIHRGDIVSTKTKAALEALNEKLLSSPPVAAVAAPATPAPVIQKAAPPNLPLNPPPAPVKAGAHFGWLVVVLAVISVAALLVAWQQFRRQRRTTSASQSLAVVQANNEPQMAQNLRDAVMQELALQRRELLLAQQTAADEIGALIHRLDELQLPIQERERAYEARIQALEKELALRTEENRELLTVKLESVRRQLEAERAVRHAGRG